MVKVYSIIYLQVMLLFFPKMTGRRGRVVCQSNGSIHYQLRSESDVSLEMLNVAEKQRFMDGEKVCRLQCAFPRGGGGGGGLDFCRRGKADTYFHSCSVIQMQNVAIISEAASSGISLQADRRAKVWWFWWNELPPNNCSLLLLPVEPQDTCPYHT